MACCGDIQEIFSSQKERKLQLHLLLQTLSYFLDSLTVKDMHATIQRKREQINSDNLMLHRPKA